VLELENHPSRIHPGRDSTAIPLIAGQEIERAVSLSPGEKPLGASGSRASRKASSAVFKNSKRIPSRAAGGISSMFLRFNSGSKTEEIPALFAASIFSLIPP